MSAWSLNRDSQCGGAFAQTGVASNTCSGVVQTPLQFTDIFSHLRGTKIANPTATAPSSPTAPATADNPNDQPVSDLERDRTVRDRLQGRLAGPDYSGELVQPGHGARFSGRGRAGGSVAALGPVPPGSHAPATVLLVTGSYPTWSASKIYHAGDRVRFGGLPYEARYYTSGDQPLRAIPATRAHRGHRCSSTPESRRPASAPGAVIVLGRRKRDPTEPRHQLGTNGHQDPMPVVPRVASDRTMAFGRAAVAITVAAWLALVVTVVNSQILQSGPGHSSLLQTAGFLTAVSLLAASAVAYLFGRLGFYYRAREHRRAPRAVIDEFFSERQPTMTVLVPSYQEEPGVILMTLLSVALQEYPDLQIVLLVDDPPNPRYAEPRRLLDAAQALPAEIERLLSDPRQRAEQALMRFEDTIDRAGDPTAEQLAAVAVDTSTPVPGCGRCLTNTR